MTYRAFADKLLDLCEHRGEEIAERWYKAVSENPRTPSYHSFPQKECISRAASVYRNLKQAFFAENPYQEVTELLERVHYVEDFYAKGIPLPEVIYGLIMMRRHIWLYAELQALFSTPIDIQ